MKVVLCSKFVVSVLLFLLSATAVQAKIEPTYVPIVVGDITIIIPVGPQWSAPVGGQEIAPLCEQPESKQWVSFFCNYMTHKQWVEAGRPLLAGKWKPVFWGSKTLHPENFGLVDSFFNIYEPTQKRFPPWSIT